MQPTRDASPLPRLPLIRESAAFFGEDVDYAALNALLGAALRFGSEAESGAWSSIYVIYGAEARRVALTVTHASSGGHFLLIESMLDDGTNVVFRNGLNAWVGSRGEWELLVAGVDGSGADTTEFMAALGDVSDLRLLEKEVADKIDVAA